MKYLDDDLLTELFVPQSQRMTSFDSIASIYDEQFTATRTGFLQRQLIYTYLEELLIKDKPKRVLELNCGTGADAIWLAQKGCHVLATDISPMMIETAKKKSEATDIGNRLDFKTIAAEDIDQLSNRAPFDLIFSNFGGLNCVSPNDMQRLAPKLTKLLAPNGCLVFVIMSRFCPWESFYFLAKGNWTQAWRRRNKTPVDAPLGNGVTVPTWYYSPKMMAKAFDTSFHLTQQRPVGFFIPPSYLDSAFEHCPQALNLLWAMEKFCSKIEWIAPVADHFLIELKKS